MSQQKPSVEVNLMERPLDKTQHFEVWVRSAINPKILMGRVVERGVFRERDMIFLVAINNAIDINEKHLDNLDPDQIARAAVEAYDELIADNPTPKIAEEL